MYKALNLWNSSGIENGKLPDFVPDCLLPTSIDELLDFFRSVGSAFWKSSSSIVKSMVSMKDRFLEGEVRSSVLVLISTFR